MSEHDRSAGARQQDNAPVQAVKIVADMPHDDEMRDELQQMRENDGYAGSCGIHPVTRKGDRP